MSDQRYERDPASIYRQSFDIVRREAELDRFPTDLQPVIVRLIHACGMVDIVEDIAFAPDVVAKAGSALQTGAAVFTDVEMVAAGIIRSRLPDKSDIVCTLNDPRVAAHAREIGNTRSAAAVDYWDERLEGAVVAIGNAPTALFHLLDRIERGGPKPAAILGFPVGFVGAAESKQELILRESGSSYLSLLGRRGGSAMASAAVNGLAAGLPELDQ
ncbi:MAG: precorrin-8X methylmutase [Stappiaceae bacterium]